MNEHGVILFDGVCNFCNNKINLVIRKDKKDFFRFAALQSEAGKKILAANGIEITPEPDTFIFIEKNKIYNRSSAALHIVKHMSGLWPALFVFIIVPRFLRDIVYKIIARNRYKWWGVRESCMVPTPEVRKKFL
jgi:predicted DCC family thiol-disulfide oxidoreductase YuxK